MASFWCSADRSFCAIRWVPGGASCRGWRRAARRSAVRGSRDRLFTRARRAPKRRARRCISAPRDSARCSASNPRPRWILQFEEKDLPGLSHGRRLSLEEVFGFSMADVSCSGAIIIDRLLPVLTPWKQDTRAPVRRRRPFRADCSGNSSAQRASRSRSCSDDCAPRGSCVVRAADCSSPISTSSWRGSRRRRAHRSATSMMVRAHRPEFDKRLDRRRSVSLALHGATVRR